MSRARIIYIITTLGSDKQSLLKRFAHTDPQELDYVLHILNTYSEVFSKTRHVYYQRAPQGMLAWGLYYLNHFMTHLEQALAEENDEMFLSSELIVYLTSEDMLAVIEAAKQQLLKLKSSSSFTAQDDVLVARKIREDAQKFWSNMVSLKNVAFTDKQEQYFVSHLQQLKSLLKKHCLSTSAHNEILSIHNDVDVYVQSIAYYKVQKTRLLETVTEEAEEHADEHVSDGLDKTVQHGIKSHKSSFAKIGIFSDKHAEAETLVDNMDVKVRNACVQ